MLEYLKLANFQRHKCRLLKLDPYITCIVGRTDSGKSSFLRALRWLCLNRPGGDHFIHWDMEHAAVSVKIDGQSVIRHRSVAVNSYWLDGNKLTAFGTDVPQPVANLLNVDEGNFQTQRANPFWLTATPGELSRELNRIVNLDLIDRVLAFLASARRKAAETVCVSQERLQLAQTRKEGLDWVPDADAALKAVEALERDMAAMKRKRDDIAFILEKAQGQAKEQKAVAKALPAARKAILIYQEALGLDKKRQGIKLLLDEIIKLGGEKCQVREKLRKERDELRMKIGNICPLCGGQPIQPL